MSGRSERSVSDQALGGYRPKPWASPESSMDVLPPSKESGSLGSRNFTPKGHKFTNLDDAFQAITARKASQASVASTSKTPTLSHTDSLGSSVNTLDSTCLPPDKTLVPTDQSQQQQPMELAHADHPVKGRSLTAPFPAKQSAAKDGDASPRSPATLNTLDSLDTSLGNVIDKRKPRETGSTVENIYNQYLPSSESSSSAEQFRPVSPLSETSSDTKAYGRPETPSDVHEDGVDMNYSLAAADNTRASKTKDTSTAVDAGKNRWQLYFSAGDAPETPLPDLPQGHDYLEDYDMSSMVRSVSSLSDSQELLNNGVAKGARVCGSGILLPDRPPPPPPSRYVTAPLPARVQSIKKQAAQDTNVVNGQRQSLRDITNHHDSFVSNCGISYAGFSTGGLTSESDEDPFKYDRQSYGIFLQPSKEREVSMALQRMGSTGTTHSRVTAHSQLSPIQGSSPPPMPPLPLAHNVSHLPAKNTSKKNPFFDGITLHRYQNPAVEYDWDEGDDPTQVKISVKPQMMSSSPPRAPTGLGVHLDKFADQEFQDHAHIMSEGGDWETVGTDIGNFDSNRACASGTTYSGGHHIIKTTGSSIADYSDAGDFPPPPSFDQSFSSADRILQHPGAGDYITNSSCQLRNLKDTGRPVFLPKPRLHRVNGYPTNSNRIFTDPTSKSSGTSAKDYFSEKLQNWRNPYEDIGRSSRFNFRDSVGHQDQDEARKVKVARDATRKEGSKLNPTVNTRKLKVPESHGKRISKRHSKIVPAAIEPPVGRAHDKEVHQPSESFCPESPNQFAFPLISLPEAARLQAMKRQSEDDDQTFTSTVRTRKAFSVVSSKATQKTTPPIPHVGVTKPPPTRPARPPTLYGHPYDSEPYRSNTGRSSTVSSSNHSRYEQPVSSFSPDSSRRSSEESRFPRPIHIPRSLRNPFSSFHAGPLEFRRPRSRFEHPPRLWTRTRRDLHRHNASDNNRRSAAAEAGEPYEIGNTFGVSNDEAYMSWEGRKRRQYFYYLMCLLSLFPFIAPLVCMGTFNSALSWYTKGETGRLNPKQHRRVKMVGIVAAGLWLVIIAVVVTLVVNASKKA
ncbi:hypothetical protein B0T17DRAFT_643034 [Bombardia bombarda]|uniref:Uncharacterized protein n=1 Tax=Bombardia bombarda TaxID=252184 RepID=A0AA39WM64_9PEZI|nr:hypothetical protein B0T17DRAFT_643034 [Bombardia bombarda]